MWKGAAAMNGLRLISADSHVDEPEDLWLTRLPQDLRHRAPRFETRAGGRRRLVVEGLRAGWAGTLNNQRVGAIYPGKRLADLDLDGIAGEVVYPTTGLWLWSIEDAALGLACIRVYNDWIAQALAGHEERLRPVGLVPVWDLDMAIAELRRIRKLGLGAAMFPNRVQYRPYNDPAYDRVWAEAAELGLPVSFHIGTGHDMIHFTGPGAGTVNYAVTAGMAGHTLALLALSGAMERFPALHFTTVECGGGWLAWLMNILDEGYTDHAGWVNPKLKELPSFYLKRQAHVTFQDDQVAVHNRVFTGTGPLLWGSDYPHLEGTWPHSREAVQRQFGAIAPEERAAIVGGNAARVWGF